jgi:hypothetical protein
LATRRSSFVAPKSTAPSSIPPSRDKLRPLQGFDRHRDIGAILCPRGAGSTQAATSPTGVRRTARSPYATRVPVCPPVSIQQLSGKVWG